MSETLKEIGSHLLVSFAWLVLVTFFRLDLQQKLVLLLLGTLAGTFLLDIDHLIYWFYLWPEKQDSKIARRLLEKKDFLGLLFLAARYHDTHTRLVFHSALFQIVLLGLTFYFFTTGGSYFGIGVLAALNLHLLKDEWEEYFGGSILHLNDWLFWQIKTKVSLEAQKFYLVLVTFSFLFLSLFVV